MNRNISLLRGINVSGQKKIKMEDLRQMYESLGFVNVQSYIQSGNVIFSSEEADTAKLKQQIEQGIDVKFGFEVEVLVLSAERFKQLVKGNPFAGDQVYLTFLFNKPNEIPHLKFENALAESEKLQIEDQVVYFSCPDGYGRTKLSNNFLEKKLGVSATTRNWRTVNKLIEMVEQ